MKKLQDALATDLADGLGEGFTVLDYPPVIDHPSRPTVAVWPTSLAQLAEAPNGRYRVEFTVELYSRHEAPDLAEADLADTLAAVLAVLWERDDYLLARAERTVSTDRRLHAWTLTVTGGLKLTPSED